MIRLSPPAVAAGGAFLAVLLGALAIWILRGPAILLDISNVFCS
jgi:hypothetical protein